MVILLIIGRNKKDEEYIRDIIKTIDKTDYFGLGDRCVVKIERIVLNYLNSLLEKEHYKYEYEMKIYHEGTKFCLFFGTEEITTLRREINKIFKEEE